LILGREHEFHILHSVKTGFGAHTASYPMDTEGSIDRYSLKEAVNVAGLVKG
jgi:hypothetical protein